MKPEAPVKTGLCRLYGCHCGLFEVKYQLDLFRRGPQAQWKGSCGLHLDKPDCYQLKSNGGQR